MILVQASGTHMHLTTYWSKLVEKVPDIFFACTSCYTANEHFLDPAIEASALLQIEHQQFKSYFRCSALLNRF